MKTFFLRTTGVDFSKIRRVGSYDDSGFLLGTTSMSLGIAYEPRARNIICHPCAVDLMINETIYYTTRVDDIFTSSSKSFSVSKRNPQSRWTIKIL